MSEPNVARNQRNDDTWNANFRLLIKYMEKHGPGWITVDWDTKFGRWMKQQRQHKQTNKLREDRLAKLNDIKFPWKKGVFTIRQSSK